MSNIEDVTNSPDDWSDFWYSPEAHGAWDVDKVKRWQYTTSRPKVIELPIPKKT